MRVRFGRYVSHFLFLSRRAVAYPTVSISRVNQMAQIIPAAGAGEHPPMTYLENVAPSQSSLDATLAEQDRPREPHHVD